MIVSTNSVRRGFVPFNESHQTSLQRPLVPPDLLLPVQELLRTYDDEHRPTYDDELLRTYDEPRPVAAPAAGGRSHSPDNWEERSTRGYGKPKKQVVMELDR